MNHDELTADELAAVAAALADPVTITGDPKSILEDKVACDEGVAIARLIALANPGRKVEVNMEEFQIRLWDKAERHYVIFAEGYVAPPTKGRPGTVWVRR